MLTDPLATAQSRVHEGRPGALAEMYRALVCAVSRLCTSPRLRPAVDELSHDVATRLVERYQRKPEYTVVAWSHILRVELLHAVSERGPNRERRREAAREAYVIASERTEPAVMPDMTRALYELLRGHDRGQDIAVRLIRGRSYRAGILAVEQIAGRRWIYEHAAQLRQVWMISRGRGGESGNVDQPVAGTADSSQSTLRALRPVVERPCSRAVGGILGIGRRAAGNGSGAVQALRVETGRGGSDAASGLCGG